MSDKPKRAPSVWASLVAAHIKGGGKFPKKGSADYDKLRKQLDDHKAGKSAPAAPAAAAPAAKAPRKKKASGVPMPVTDAPIAPVEPAALPAPKKPRTRKVAASKVETTKVEKMDNPAQTALEASEEMLHKAMTGSKIAAKRAPKVMKGKTAPELTETVGTIAGAGKTVPLARITGVQNIKIPFTERLVPNISPPNIIT